MPDRHHGDGVVESSRSRSPPIRPGHRAHRTRSPHRHGRRRRDNNSPTRASAAKELPYASRQISKRDYVLFRPMFALYLDIQKQRVLDDMNDMEAKGRWKSFVGKWNRGELSEGWYDPSTLQKAIVAASFSPILSRDPSLQGPLKPKKGQKQKQKPLQQGGVPSKEGDLESDGTSTSTSTSTSSIGPSLPGKSQGLGKESHPHSRKTGTFKTPNTRPLHHLNDDDDDADLLLLSGPPPSTHARRQEARSLHSEKMKLFAEAKNGGMVEDVDDRVFFGGEAEGEGEVVEVEGKGQGQGQAQGKGKGEEGRKKGEREARREEVMRMRREEREERLGEYRRREEETMGMLREMARQRFGQGGEG